MNFGRVRPREGEAERGRVRPEGGLVRPKGGCVVEARGRVGEAKEGIFWGEVLLHIPPEVML